MRQMVDGHAMDDKFWPEVRRSHLSQNGFAAMTAKSAGTVEWQSIAAWSVAKTCHREASERTHDAGHAKGREANHAERSAARLITRLYDRTRFLR